MSTAGLVSRRDCSHQLHVLAVDDSVVDRKFVERLLKISSCKVTAVESGIRALQFLGLDGEKKETAGFDGLKVNLIMTDYSMPGMNGFELLKKIKESSTLKEIPVVIMSSENILTRVDRCLEEGAEEFIVKPVKLSDVKRLKNILTKGDKGQNEEDPLLSLPLSSHDLASSSTSSSSPFKFLDHRSSGLDCKADSSSSCELPVRGSTHAC